MSATTIFVDNISANTNVVDVEIAFGAANGGSVSRVYIPTFRKTGTNRGFAFVTMASNADAEEAMLYMQGYRSDYMIWNLSWAKPNNNKKRTRKQKKKQRQQKQQQQPPTTKKNESDKSIKAEIEGRHKCKAKLKKKKPKKDGSEKERRDSLASSNASTVPTIAESVYSSG